MTDTGGIPAGWYHAPGDAEGTQRYWDGGQWTGEPQMSQPQTPPAPSLAPPPPPGPGGQASPAFGQNPGAPSNSGQSAPPPYGGQSAPPPYGQSAPGGGAPPPGAPPGYVPFGQQGSATTANLASPGQRIGARLIDWIIWIVVTVVIAIVFGASFVATGGDAAGAFSGLIAGALVVAYEVGMVATRGATLGKMALGLKVVNEDGSPPDLKVAAMRMILYIASIVIGLLPLLGGLFGLALIVVGIVSLVFLFTDDNRQAVWDKIANTLVVDS